MQVTEYLQEEFGKATGHFEHHIPPPVKADPSRFDFRAWWVRTVYPHDLSFWRTIKNPWWKLHFFLSIFPFYGVAPIYWIVNFAMIERSDE